MKVKLTVYCGIVLSSLVLFNVKACGASESEQHELSIQVSLRDAPAEALRWRNVRKVLNTFAELGHCRVEINDFVWDSSWIDNAKVYRHDDPLALGEDSNKIMREWAERNQGCLVELWIGENVEFDRIKCVTECLRDHDSNYILYFLKNNPNGLILNLYGSVQRKGNKEPQ
ncbi:hypothetical protein [Pontiella agarivorans]|uniref:Lipoprotein n=1 Tax=Pontiella agarivorans TaxID=3038953 RepID=A0ABU5MYG3_9BACT|nr:hypothetical protein [Pontiella agarivorans]MDZ8119225.1 hypothetical protein [Pontiella agarivorans]